MGAKHHSQNVRMQGNEFGEVTMSVIRNIWMLRDNSDKLMHHRYSVPHYWLRQNESVTAVDRATVTASTSAK
jgi:hypothetical protein